MLPIPIVLRCYHGNPLFRMCQVILRGGKIMNLSNFQDINLIIIKFGGGGIFRLYVQIHKKISIMISF